MAIFTMRQIKNPYTINKDKTPTNPNSSAITEKIKSVCGSGKNLYCTWLPLPNPSPKICPEPTEIFVWFWLHEAPR